MKEQEYINICNHIALKNALQCLEDCTFGTWNNNALLKARKELVYLRDDTHKKIKESKEK